ARGRARDPVRSALALSPAARACRAGQDRARLAALARRRISRRARLAVLVSGLRARDRRKRAHAGAGRGAVRAGDLALCVQAADRAARGMGDRADRDWSGAIGLGVLSAASHSELIIRCRLPTTGRSRPSITFRDGGLWRERGRELYLANLRD